MPLATTTMHRMRRRRPWRVLAILAVLLLGTGAAEFAHRQAAHTESRCAGGLLAACQHQPGHRQHAHHQHPHDHAHDEHGQQGEAPLPGDQPARDCATCEFLATIAAAPATTAPAVLHFLAVRIEAPRPVDRLRQIAPPRELSARAPPIGRVRG